MRTVHETALPGYEAVVLLTRIEVATTRSRVTVAPVIRKGRGLAVEVPLGPRNGVARGCVADIDATQTVPVGRVGEAIGILDARQEAAVVRAVILAFDLDAGPLRP